MSVDDIRDTVVRIIADHLGLPVSSLDIGSRIIEDLGGDWLDQTELIITIEERFGVDISQAERTSLIRISDIITYLESRSPDLDKRLSGQVK
jgi:acyl carrier protein